jgi:hypothetical protein
VTRLISSILVLMVAAPAIGWGDPMLPEGVELVLPADCCCPEDEEAQTTPEFERACCCELNPPAQGVAAISILAESGNEWELPPPGAISSAAPPSLQAPREQGVANAARGPPPRPSLFAQKTSLLL